MSTYDKAFDRVIGHEGKFQNDARDRGNWTTGIIGQGINKGTKFGISAMSYPNEDIKNLTVARAKELYKRDFWDRNNVGSLHTSIQYQMFDAAINHGRGNAARMLQRAVHAADDGAIGKLTLDAYRAMCEADILLRFLAERLEFMTKLSTFVTYGRGWSARIAVNLRYAAEDNVDGCRN